MIKKLIDELEYWEFIGIDSDIYQCPDHRLEYKPFVVEAKNLGLYEKEITKYVLNKLYLELQKPWYKRLKYISYLYLLKIKKLKLMIKI